MLITYLENLLIWSILTQLFLIFGFQIFFRKGFYEASFKLPLYQLSTLSRPRRFFIDYIFLENNISKTQNEHKNKLVLERFMRLKIYFKT